MAFFKVIIYSLSLVDMSTDEDLRLLESGHIVFMQVRSCFDLKARQVRFKLDRSTVPDFESEPYGKTAGNVPQRRGAAAAGAARLGLVNGW